MNIRTQLLVAHSKQNATYISNYIGNDNAKFSELMKLFLSNEYRVTQRAAYSLGISIDNFPTLIDPYIEVLIHNLDVDNLHVAVLRNTLRILQNIEIPIALEGKITNKCFDYLTSKDEPKAVKVFAMTIIANMAIKYPDLKNELKIIVEGLMEFGSPGILSRGKRTLLALEKIIQRD